MAVTFPEKVLAVLQEGLSLWKTFISTRQEAYNRSMDKKIRKAIEYGERACLRVKELKVDDAELNKWIDAFFKYN